MATGEGKTLVATLPAFLNALAHRGVHIVTVNSCLATRDSVMDGALYTSSTVYRLTVFPSTSPTLQPAAMPHRAGITYGTNNEFGFDYLRDNMARDPGELRRATTTTPWWTR